MHWAFDADDFKASLETCKNIVPGMGVFEVTTTTAALAASCDVVFYSEFDSAAALQACQVHPHHQCVSAALTQLRQSRIYADYEV